MPLFVFFLVCEYLFVFFLLHCFTNCRSFARSLCFARKNTQRPCSSRIVVASFERGTKRRRRRRRPPSLSLDPLNSRERARGRLLMPAFETSNAAAADERIRRDRDDGNASSSLLAKPIKTVKDKFELLPAFLKVRGLGTTTTLVSRAHSFGLVSLCSYVRRGPTRTDM